MDGPEDSSKAHIYLLKTYMHSLKENLGQEHPANLILEGAGRRDRMMNTTVIIKRRIESQNLQELRSGSRS